ncbi:hypothetical protein Rhopal_007063-T1 [Rhodotorula paludigena]|uniref:Very-long-chain (3R)-3-hydroxyacyl-CoA dehydratase n=1 Tax=Rhodotorula paludigena TaxID=86838 RepID=A0AAV5GVM4_9BASI|nr:hypothetical protein Rhopal_007063-T1 [Rhodotorula paludigena]
MPATPKTTPSKGKPAHSRSSSSPLATVYLTLYNLASAAAWGYVLVRVAVHMAGGDGYTGIKEWAGLQSAGETALKRASGAVDEIGDTVKWVQTAALLEALHSATGLVLCQHVWDGLLTVFAAPLRSRSPFGTTVAQVASRLALVWGVCEFFPEVPRSPIYVSMVAAWSLAEIIRYTHYATGLMGLQVKTLEWIRYTAFYILYPVGAGSEAVLIFKSAEPAAARYGTLAGVAVYLLCAIWPPSLAFLMSYMHAQRRKHLSGSSRSRKSSPPPVSFAEAAKKVITDASGLTTPPKASSVAPRDITSRVSAENVLGETAGQTPARSTRSRSKKVQ